MICNTYCFSTKTMVGRKCLIITLSAHCLSAHPSYELHKKTDTNAQQLQNRLNLICCFDVLLTVHLSIFISVINQLDAQNFCFTISLFLHVSSICAHHQEVKIALHSLWYHHTETSECSKITKIQFYKYEQILVKFMCL